MYSLTKTPNRGASQNMRTNKYFDESFKYDYENQHTLLSGYSCLLKAKSETSKQLNITLDENSNSSVQNKKKP